MGWDSNGPGRSWRIPRAAWGYLDRTGTVAIDPRFPAPVDRAVRPFSEGRAAFAEGTKWGYIDKRGKVVIPATFDEAGFFRDGIAPVRRMKAWMLMTADGELHAEPDTQSGARCQLAVNNPGYTGLHATLPHDPHWTYPAYRLPALRLGGSLPAP